jgi:hypothetical protein
LENIFSIIKYFFLREAVGSRGILWLQLDWALR